MDKTRLFEFLSTQDTPLLLDLLGQAYDQMDVDQRRWVLCRDRASEYPDRTVALETLAERENETWYEVDALIQQSQAKQYDEAVRLLKNLEELAAYQNRRSAFEERLRQVRKRYRRRHALMDRLRKAGLVGP